MFDELLRYWNAVSNFVGDSKFLNSSFVTSLLGAGAGAWAGAYAAQRIASRVKAREEILKEVGNVNAAISVGASVGNAALGLKKQHVANLWHRFSDDRARVDDFRSRREQGLAQYEPPPKCVFDLRTLESPKFATSILLTLIFEKMTPSSKIVISGDALVGSIHTLMELIQKRNSWIESFKATPMDDAARGALYFGLEIGNGHRDDTYPSFVEGIHRATEDCIFFSMFLIEALRAYGCKVRDNYLLKYGGDAPSGSSLT